ncbi:MAG: hypothetical protein K2M91_14405 [Lachnospiraceae bacterium]|nr:hypothetical protein [Lachnospiraceae bacterium]
MALPIRELLRSMDENDRFANNLNLLLAQIYEDLLQEPNQAYRSISEYTEAVYLYGKKLIRVNLFHL